MAPTRQGLIAAGPDYGEVEEIWMYRGRQLRLVTGTLGYQGEIWENGARKARIRFGPLASREMAVEGTERAAFDLGPLHPDARE